MANYLLSVRNYLGWLLLILTSYSLSRLIFLVCNIDYIETVTILNFLGGVRFDLSIIALLNLPFTLLVCFPVNRVFGQSKIFRLSFLIINLTGIAFNFIDAAYFAFTLKRTTSDIFITNGLGLDILRLLPSFIADFWYLFILFFGLSWLLFKITKPAVAVGISTKKNIIWRILIWLLMTALSVVAYRGGLQLRPLSIVSASSYGNSRQIALILNTPFTIIRTATQAKLKPVQYFTDEEVNTILPLTRTFSNSGDNAIKKNVVLIILESLGEEYIGSLSGLKSYTPFLDSLMPYCNRPIQGFANGRKSIEAMPSITASIPALMETPFVSSGFAGNKINALPELLNKRGYSTAFFHGGINGTMGFDVYASLAGYQAYYGLNEYPDKKDYDGNWGVPDEPYLQYFSKTISSLKQPFFTTVFTLSSHHPFKVPEKYKNAFPKGDLPIHESVGYTDMSLRKFFESAKKEAWYNNTLFVITADHTSLSNHTYYSNGSGTFAIPILFFEPGKPGAVWNTIGQQLDITPTILDLLGNNGNYCFLGRSLPKADSTNCAISYLNDTYLLLNSGYLLRFNGEQATALFNLATDSLLTNDVLHKNPDKVLELTKMTKAYIQQYNNRLINNTLTRP